MKIISDPTPLVLSNIEHTIFRAFGNLLAPLRVKSSNR
jgi:hypothetical protein